MTSATAVATVSHPIVSTIAPPMNSRGQAIWASRLNVSFTSSVSLAHLGAAPIGYVTGRINSARLSTRPAQATEHKGFTPIGPKKTVSRTVKGPSSPDHCKGLRRHLARCECDAGNRIAAGVSRFRSRSSELMARCTNQKTNIRFGTGSIGRGRNCAVPTVRISRRGQRAQGQASRPSLRQRFEAVAVESRQRAA